MNGYVVSYPSEVEGEPNDVAVATGEHALVDALRIVVEAFNEVGSKHDEHRIEVGCTCKKA